MSKATPNQIRQSAQTRRNGALQDVLQIYRDVNHYNKYHNPDEDIEQSFNFDLDIEERQLALFEPTDDEDCDE